MQDSARQRLEELESEIASRLKHVASHLDEDQFAALARRIALTKLRSELLKERYERLIGQIDSTRDAPP